MKILNSQGQPIQLNDMEKFHNNWMKKQIDERFGNALGAEIDITSLTTIMKKISEQKFFEVAPADYLPIRVGEGAWSSTLTTYRSYSTGDDFATGILNTGGSDARLAATNTAVDSLTVKVKDWAKTIGWSIFDLQKASKSGNWDLITSLEEGRKRNWDLGIQSIAFLGMPGDASVLGLMTQVGVTTNLTRITAPISSLNEAGLKVFVANLLNDYRVNCARTAWPTHFVIPESDFIGLASQASATFPMKTVMELLLEAFKLITKKDFQILPLAYNDAAYNPAGKQLYALYNYDEKSIRMDLPVDYTNTLANSLNNFSFQNVGYGQFTGALAYRPAEMLYFQY